MAGSACAPTRPCPCSRPPRPTASSKAPTSTSASSSPSGSAGPRDLLLADVGQVLAQFDDQRIALGQDALQAVDRVAQQGAGITVAPQLAVQLGQLRTAAQRFGVTGAEHPLEPGPGLLAGQFRRRRVAGLLVGGTEVVPRRKRVQVIGPEDALPV